MGDVRHAAEGKPRAYLLTGPPGCGKTTVIRETLRLVERPAAGFYTEEVRAASGGRRLGFDVIRVDDGRRGVLARAGGRGPRVGAYAVDVASFERIGVLGLEEGLRRAEVLLVVDELGKMEFHSRAFVELLERVFAGCNPVLGAIMERRHPTADRFRTWPGVALVDVTQANRGELPGRLARLVSGV